MNILEKARKKLRLTQKDIARKCNIDQSSISRIENLEELPSFENIKKIAKELNLCPADIHRAFYCKDCYRTHCTCKIE